jgi:uncharacterized membrane protein
MKLKKNLLALVMLCLLFAGPASAAVVIDPAPKAENPKELTADQKARIEEMKNRVAEIKALRKSSLTKEERKALRQELKDMNKEAKAIQGRGVYLSVGAIIIIILLLILIL